MASVLDFNFLPFLTDFLYVVETIKYLGCAPLNIGEVLVHKIFQINFMLDDHHVDEPLHLQLRGSH